MGERARERRKIEKNSSEFNSVIEIIKVPLSCIAGERDVGWEIMCGCNNMGNDEIRKINKRQENWIRFLFFEVE